MSRHHVLTELVCTNFPIVHLQPHCVSSLEALVIQANEASLECLGKPQSAYPTGRPVKDGKDAGGSRTKLADSR